MEIQMSKAGAMEAAGETATFIRCVRQPLELEDFGQ
uniref:Uncharacterized protein n=1 Tax=Leersia perrieri TaxID=77586 RepID=A0A0D9XGH2_9ORYZ